MKKNRNSFTLIELLTVVAIISILVGLIVPTIAYARTQTLKTRARSEIDSLRIALRSYYQEYGYWPIPPGTNWVDLSTMLNGNVHPQTGVAAGAGSWAATNNFRGIRFMEFKQDSVTSGGSFIDPWGTSYCVLMDHGGGAVGRSVWTDGTREDNQVTNPNGGQIQAQIAIYSYGPNKANGNGADNTDDVKSWSN